MSMQEMPDGFESRRFKQKKLITKKLDGELLLFEKETNTAHCLNDIAAEMWLACERESSATDITHCLRMRWPDVEQEVVVASLGRMAATGLLVETIAQEKISTDRRDLIRKLGLTAAAVLPIVVTTVLIPPAAAAASCGTTGAICGEGKPPCCPGFHCVLGTLLCAPNL
jgi:hypothetical protein